MNKDLPLQLLCNHPELHKEDVITLPSIALEGGKSFPPYRWMSGDHADDGCIDLGPFKIPDGIYECRMASSLPKNLMFQSINLSPCRLVDLKLEQKTQSGVTVLHLKELINNSLQPAMCIMAFGLSHENLIGRCKNGDYLLQGIMDFTLSIHLSIGIISGKAEDVTFGCSVFDWV